MKRFYIPLMVCLLFVGFALEAKPIPPRLLWRGSSGIDIAKVDAPKGFDVSPYDVAKKTIILIMQIDPNYERYVFADHESYYIGTALKKSDFSVPVKPHWMIHGITGAVIYIE